MNTFLSIKGKITNSLLLRRDPSACSTNNSNLPESNGAAAEVGHRMDIGSGWEHLPGEGAADDKGRR